MDPAGHATAKIVSEARLLVLEFFDGDATKTELWFQTNNPLLCMSPNGMIAMGRIDKLLTFIRNQIEENKGLR